MHGPQIVKSSKKTVQSYRSQSFRNEYCCLEQVHPLLTDDSYWIATVLEDMHTFFTDEGYTMLD
jgi:hypothetical protein